MKLHNRTVFTVVVLTVLLSALCHGLSANPAAKRWGARLDRARANSKWALPEHDQVMEHSDGDEQGLFS